MVPSIVAASQAAIGHLLALVLVMVPILDDLVDLAALEVADLSNNVFVAVVENSSFLVAVLAPTARSPRCRGSRCPRGGTGQSCSQS